MADTVLIANDDETVLTMLYKVIRSNGIEANTVASGEEALEQTAQRMYGLILLDVSLTGMSGFQVIQTLWQRGVRILTIVVSGCREDYGTLYGLSIGADDYMTKSFNPVTLGAKVKAPIRRSRSGLSGADSLITAGPFTYNTSTLRFHKNGVEILLSTEENVMVKLSIGNVNRISSEDMFYDLLWGEVIIGEDTTMVYVNHLRVRTEEGLTRPAHIQTVRGLGYYFVV